MGCVFSALRYNRLVLTGSDDVFVVSDLDAKSVHSLPGAVEGQSGARGRPPVQLLMPQSVGVVQYQYEEASILFLIIYLSKM